MRSSKKYALVAVAFLFSASTGFALGMYPQGAEKLRGGTVCSDSSQCNQNAGECCAIAGPNVGVCAPRDLGIPCLDA
ncbi:hypothetical protein JGU66_33360 [Myxococcaceae bacterium JPH2]|nr:hypothetical protein [Myxococcaceae bacterium JPH2]